jgi:hypothetical protein
MANKKITITIFILVGVFAVAVVLSGIFDNDKKLKREYNRALIQWSHGQSIFYTGNPMKGLFDRRTDEEKNKMIEALKIIDNLEEDWQIEDENFSYYDIGEFDKIIDIERFYRSKDNNIAVISYRYYFDQDASDFYEPVLLKEKRLIIEGFEILENTATFYLDSIEQ